MLQEYIDEDLGSLNNIDTSEIDHDIDDSSVEVDDEQFVDDDVYVDVSEEIEGLDEEFHLCDDEQLSTEEEHHQHEEQEHTGISFKGHGRCKLCGCGKWAGYGNVCKNCGHFFDKHYSL